MIHLRKTCNNFCTPTLHFHACCLVSILYYLRYFPIVSIGIFYYSLTERNMLLWWAQYTAEVTTCSSALAYLHRRVKFFWGVQCRFYPIPFLHLFFLNIIGVKWVITHENEGFFMNFLPFRMILDDFILRIPWINDNLSANAHTVYSSDVVINKNTLIYLFLTLKFFFFQSFLHFHFLLFQDATWCKAYWKRGRRD